ncbi:MAG: hypothetical protein QOC76_5120 [Mycobacterium sp.]|jgi:hypothetical protein|nr:hypothetical protein [Mycobacterium sp.]
MRRAICSTWITVVGVAVAISVAGCGGTDESGASSPPVDPDVAFKQYDEASKPVDCSQAYGAMGDAHHDGDLVVMKEKAREYRDVVATWDSQLGNIAFPAAARRIVDKMRDLIANELAGLNELADGNGQDADRTATVRSQVEADDALVVVEGDDLRAALGHPVPQSMYAADQLEWAERTFLKETSPVHAKWEAALGADDLNGAKAANGIEEAALQRYIDKLGTVSWPAGTFEAQANTLREHLRGLIEFDRRQVDVATAAQIARTPEEGAPDYRFAEDAKEKLWTVLVRSGHSVDPPSC